MFQELTLLPWMTVAENLLLLREPRGFLGLIDRRRMFKEAEAILVGMGVRSVDPRILIEDLSLAKRQIVEIARAMAQEPDTLLLDEPTSSLGDSEVEWLFGLVRDLRARGKCIIFTSHRWNEVTHIADRITIFRNGKDIGAFTEIDESEAVSLMTGQHVEAHFPPPPSLRAARPTLQARGLAGRGLAASSLTVHAGEILGVGGLAGQGHRELFFSLFGAAPTTGGEILVDGAPARMKSPRHAAHAGIALVPEDRKTEGLLLPLSVGVNLTLAILPRIFDAGGGGGRARTRARRADGRRAEDQDARPGQSGRKAQRRQPAEGAARPLAARRLACLHSEMSTQDVVSGVAPAFGRSVPQARASEGIES